MVWIHLVTLLAVAQYIAFSVLVGRARERYQVKAPAVTGHEGFERQYRVQMNTLELLVAFLPALWLAAQYAQPGWMAAIGAVYLVGRMVYLRAYVSNPASRSLGFVLSALPMGVLVLVGLVGAVRSLLA